MQTSSLLNEVMHASVTRFVQTLKLLPLNRKSGSVITVRLRRMIVISQLKLYVNWCYWRVVNNFKMPSTESLRNGTNVIWTTNLGTKLTNTMISSIFHISWDGNYTRITCLDCTDILTTKTTNFQIITCKATTQSTGIPHPRTHAHTSLSALLCQLYATGYLNLASTTLQS